MLPCPEEIENPHLEHHEGNRKQYLLSSLVSALKLSLICNEHTGGALSAK